MPSHDRAEVPYNPGAITANVPKHVELNTSADVPGLGSGAKVRGAEVVNESSVFVTLRVNGVAYPVNANSAPSLDFPFTAESMLIEAATAIATGKLRFLFKVEMPEA